MPTTSDEHLAARVLTELSSPQASPRTPRPFRRRWAVTLGAGQTWPDQDAAGLPGWAEPFNWLRLENTGGGDLSLSPSHLVSSDPGVVWTAVPPGKVVVCNVAGPVDCEGDSWWRRLWLWSSVGTTAVLEVSNRPIVYERHSGAENVNTNVVNAPAVVASAAIVASLQPGPQTSTWTSQPLSVGIYRELAIDFSLSALTGTSPTAQFYVDRQDAFGNWWQIANGTSHTSAPASDTLSVGSGTYSQHSIGDVIRCRVVLGGTSPSATFSVSVKGKS